MNQDCINLENSTSWIDQLYQEHGKFIESILQYAVKDSQERDDIYQDIFMAMLKVNNPNGIQDIRDYLYVLTINKVHEHKRKKIRGRQILKAYADVLSRIPPSVTADATVVREEAARMLNLVESCLSKKESEAVLLRYRDTADAEQAAKAMNISKRSFVRYVSVGMKKIRAIVQSSEKVKE